LLCYFGRLHFYTPAKVLLKNLGMGPYGDSFMANKPTLAAQFVLF